MGKKRAEKLSTNDILDSADRGAYESEGEANETKDKNPRKRMSETEGDKSTEIGNECRKSITTLLLCLIWRSTRDKEKENPKEERCSSRRGN